MSSAGSLLGGITVVAGVVASAGDEITHYGALAAMALGFVASVYSVKLKTTLQAAQGSADAWKDERDAAIARADRLAEAVAAAEARAHAAETRLEARPDLTALQVQMREQHSEAMQAFGGMTSALERIAERADRPPGSVASPA